MAWLEKRDGKYKVCYRDDTGKTRRINAYTDRLASKQLMAELEKALARGEQGLVDPYKEHKQRPLAGHVQDYVAELKALGRDDKYVEVCQARLNALIGSCGWRLLRDIAADSFCRWREALPKMEDERTQIGPRTQNQYFESIRAFCNWCVKRQRIASNPLKHVEKVEEVSDVRRARRALSALQVNAFLAVVPTVHQMPYRLILATGLRRQELCDLQWGDVRLDVPTPFIQLRAKATKSRRADTVPLRTDIAGELRALRDGATDAVPVFDKVPSMKEHRSYLDAAGIEWEDSEGRRADLHAFRHTYGTLLSNGGVSPREAMELMRHTDLRLTMKVYTDPRIFNLAGAVERLPIPERVNVSVATTGTNGAIQSVVSPVANRVAKTSIQRQEQTATDSKNNLPKQSQVIEQASVKYETAVIGNDLPGKEKNSTGRTRTYVKPADSLGNSRVSRMAGSKTSGKISETAIVANGQCATESGNEVLSANERRAEWQQEAPELLELANLWPSLGEADHFRGN